MNNKFMLLSAAIALALASGAAMAADDIRIDNSTDATKAIQQSQPASADARIEVSNVRGQINITASERGSIDISGSLGAGSALLISGTADHLSVRVEADKNDGWSWWGGNGPKTDTVLNISLPRRARVSVDAVSADVDVKGIDGGAELEVESVSGDVRINARTDSLRITSVSGDLEFTGAAGRSKLESVSGDLRADGLSGSVAVESVSGDAHLSANEVTRFDGSTVSGDLELQTGLSGKARVQAESMSGDVTLRLPANLSARVQANTFSGTIRSDFGKAVEEEHGPGSSLTATAGAGDAEVRVESFSGDIGIQRN